METVPLVYEHLIPDYRANSYALQQVNATIWIRITPKETKVLQDGILGLFGAHKDEPEYSVSTSLSFSNPSGNRVTFYVPGETRYDTQIL